jgi:hypothetical protein
MFPYNSMSRLANASRRMSDMRRDWGRWSKGEKAGAACFSGCAFICLATLWLATVH